VSTITVELPDAFRAAPGELAREQGVTVDQLLASALAEKVSALAGPEWLAARAARGDRAKFEEALGKVADVQPEERDGL
jgi:post-segregation antitoxin (ccd killing protein)